ncbi:hypothetical protein D0865_06512 [Hortaea werneckii]|uniref:Xylanolytic transcriptional activator regulatory domain-containing protein n=1 Tax=Hortaea werneckii TaxID=91943 RepID=A0A3M7CG60_HORWE|nr:hypothetical protein D0865_06512 [Hortaea werneckii]
MEDAAGSDVPAHRACAHCRSQKVRCLPSDANPNICQRCKRKQRKRTDTRVAELESEMRSMRQMLKDKQDGASGPSDKASTVNVQRQQGQDNTFAASSRHDHHLGEPSNPVTSAMQPAVQTPQNALPARSAAVTERTDSDIVDRGILSMATARQLFETYRKDLFPHYPFIPIPESMVAEEMRETQPTLFLAIVAAAAAKEHSDLSATLDKEVLQQYATKVVVQSEKSLELVQALHISAIWYHPPSKFGQLKYYEYIHMAATMAMDIGIGTRPAEQRNRFPGAGRGGASSWHSSSIHPIEDIADPDLSMAPRSRVQSDNTAETTNRRAFLACYAICAAVSLALRRPNMLRANSYVRECAEYLEQSKDSLPTDATLVVWSRLIMIAEEISVSFAYDDPGGIASIAELRTQLMHKDFHKRLVNWYDNVPAKAMNSSLKMMYYTVRLYLHEIALHVDHSPNDFRAPYQMGTVHPYEGEEIPTGVLAETVAQCIQCSHALLDTFLAMDHDSCRALPVFSFVRISYAAFILAKFCLSASHAGSRLGAVLDRSSLKAESYLDRAILHVREIVGPLRCRVPAIFLALLFKLRQWCMHPQMIEGPQQSQSPFLNGDTIDFANDQPSRRNLPSGDHRRIVEQSSTSSDSSPQTLAEGQQAAFESVTGLAAQEAAYQATPGSMPVSNFITGDTPGDCNMIDDNNTQQGLDFNFGPDTMNLDENFFASLGAFPEGGLTGLDDWIPQELAFNGVSQSGAYWQPGSSMGGGNGEGFG